MATITKRLGRNGRITWQATVRRAGMAKAVARTFTRRADALQWSKALEADNERAVEMSEAEAYRVNLPGAVDAYLAQYTGKDTTRGSRLRFWAELYPRRKLAELRPSDVRAGRDKLVSESARVGHGRGKTKGKTRELGRPRSDATINRYINALSALMQWAVEELDLPENPCRRVKQMSESGKRDRVLGQDEQVRLLKACRASSWDRLYLAVLLALTTGARKGEVKRLVYRDVDFIKRTTTFRETKNGDDRTVPLTGEVMDELKRLPRPIDGGTLVFASPKRPSRPFTFDKLWREAMETAGIHGLTFHGLRHTAVTRLANATRRGDAMRVAKFVGHRDLRTTMRYYHPDAEDQRDLAEALAITLEVPE